MFTNSLLKTSARKIGLDALLETMGTEFSTPDPEYTTQNGKLMGKGTEVEEGALNAAIPASLLASSKTSKGYAMCTCGHSFEEHPHPPDFGCNYEDECGCVGATEVKKKAATKHINEDISLKVADWYNWDTMWGQWIKGRLRVVDVRGMNIYAVDPQTKEMFAFNTANWPEWEPYPDNYKQLFDAKLMIPFAREHHPVPLKVGGRQIRLHEFWNPELVHDEPEGVDDFGLTDSDKVSLRDLRVLAAKKRAATINDLTKQVIPTEPTVEDATFFKESETEKTADTKSYGAGTPIGGTPNVAPAPDPTSQNPQQRSEQAVQTALPNVGTQTQEQLAQALTQQLQKSSAVEIKETPKSLPPRDDMRRHIDETAQNEVMEGVMDGVTQPAPAQPAAIPPQQPPLQQPPVQQQAQPLSAQQQLLNKVLSSAKKVVAATDEEDEEDEEDDDTLGTRYGKPLGGAHPGFSTPVKVELRTPEQLKSLSREQLESEIDYCYAMSDESSMPEDERRGALELVKQLWGEWNSRGYPPLTEDELGPTPPALLDLRDTLKGYVQHDKEPNKWDKDYLKDLRIRWSSYRGKRKSAAIRLSELEQWSRQCPSCKGLNAKKDEDGLAECSDCGCLFAL